MPCVLHCGYAKMFKYRMNVMRCCKCRKEKTFVAGGAAGKLLLNKKGWLGHDEIVLHKGEGPVSAIAWR